MVIKFNTIRVTDCTVSEVDTGDTFDVTICATHDMPPEEIDDQIFYYGLERDTLLEMCENKEAIDDEFLIVGVGDEYTFEYLDEEE